MSLRRAAALAVPLALAACTKVTQEPNPPDLIFARYSSPTIPTPNDLALAAVPAAPCGLLPNAQAQLLCTFKNAGGFPSDQEVSISIPFVAYSWDPAAGPYGAYVPVAAPAIDVASISAANLTVLQVSGTTATPVAVEAASTAGACTGGTCAPAVLTLRKVADAAGSRRWVPGARYLVAVRGGGAGVKTTTGQPIQADSGIALVLPNKDLTVVENQPLGAVPDSNGNGTNADEVASLEALRAALWVPMTWTNTGGTWHPAPLDPATNWSAMQAIDSVFPHAEMVTAATFGVAPSAGPLVLIDSGSGVAPLPIDLLRTDADGTVVNNPAFGPAAAGLDTLDGFSTTAMVLAQTSATLNASTVNAANVFLYKLAGGTATRVKDLAGALGAGAPAAARYVTQPTPIVVSQAQGCPIAGGCSSVIGLQPAVTAPVPGLGSFYLPPLDEATTYAVVVTNRVKDVAGNALVRPTVAKILLEFTAPLASGGASLIPGVNGATATSLHDMRAALEPIWAALPAGTSKADVVTAYTFRTQSITGVSLQLSAAPYLIESRAGPGGTPAAVFAVTGVTPGTVPAGTTNIAGWFDATFNSLDIVDKATGALRPTLATDLGNPGPLLKTLHALVATPLPANVPACAPPFPAGTSCAKVVVFGHGLGGSKDDLAAVADSLTARGFIAVATDFPMHGQRAWCKANAECGAGGVCTPFTGNPQPGDTVAAGTCTTGAPVAPISGQFFISGNFFRIRDAFRQNLLDQSALALAMARPPAGLAPQPTPDARAAFGLPANVLIDPSAVRWEGISLGAIAGTTVLATNPRFDRGALAVGGATLVDLFTDLQSTFAPQVNAVFLTLGIDRSQLATNPTVAANYLKTINVAKWIVDPACPSNFAGHVSASPLPNLLANPNGSVAQPAKPTLGMIAKGDAAIRNPYNELLYSLMGSSQVVYQGPGGANVSHSFLGASPEGQADAASFLFDSSIIPASPVTLP